MADSSQLQLGFARSEADARSDAADTKSVVLVTGVRSVEARVVEDVLRLCPQRPGDWKGGWRGGALPIRVVVPTSLLRLHYLSVLARERTLLGVTVETLTGMARTILDSRADTSGDLALGLVVRRVAATDPRLGEMLGHLEDPFGALVGVVRELLDAGLDRWAVDPACEAVAERTDALRIGAVLGLAARVGEVLGEGALPRRANLLVQAAAVLRNDPARLAGGAVLAVGFGHPTGAALDLLEALVAVRRARVYVERCADPFEAGQPPAEGWTHDLVSRLSMGGRADDTRRSAPARVTLLEAEGRRSALRSVAHAIQDTLDEGVAAERIGVVVRDLGGWRGVVKEVFGDLGIPCTVQDARGPTDARSRRIQALAGLVARGPDGAMAEWFALQERPAWNTVLAFRVLAAGRLFEIARLDLERHAGGKQTWPIPFRGAVDEEEPSSIARATVPLSDVVAERDAIRAFLEAWDRPVTGSDWIEGVLASLPLSPELREAIEPALVALRPLDGLRPDRGEWVRLFRRALTDAVRPASAGNTGGVLVLDAPSAHGLTFHRLFLLGLDRDVFPRPAEDDPFLPEAARVRLRAVLPDLVARSLLDEERTLFASLVDAAPEVVLGWEKTGPDGKAQAPSPFVVRLLANRSSIDRTEAFEDPGVTRLERCAPAREHAVVAGLFGFRDNHAELLGEALMEALGEANVSPRLQAARVALLEEVDPDLRTPEGRHRARKLGAFFGFVGPRDEAQRDHEPAVTTLESLARCGWRTFVLKDLQVEAPAPWTPDPSFDAARIGRIVHSVLEEIAESPEGWPDAEALLARVTDVAESELARGGRIDRLHARLLAARALAFLEVARAIDWADGAPPVEDVEARFVTRRGEGRGVPFRADRVDHRGVGRVLTDYKTSLPFTFRATEVGRSQDLLRMVETGEHLQAAAYASLGRDSMGRYVHLRPEGTPPERAVVARGDDVRLAEAFHHTVSELWAAWDAGAFFPRLVEPDGSKEPRLCRFCEVSEACLRGESTARLRFLRWLGGEHGEDDPGARTVQRLFLLGRTHG